MCDLENLKLIEPTVELESEFFAMVEEFKAEGDTFINGIGSIDIDNFATSVELAKHHAKGVDLPEGWVAASTYWLVCENRVWGTCDLRHELNDFLESYGGHIGYSIRPWQRGKGYGTVMLKLALQKAVNLGLKRVLVTCDDNNIASARVIETNGGILADKVKTQYSENPTRRYWIDLATSSQVPIDEIVEIDKLNMSGFIEKLGGKFDPHRRRQSIKEEIGKGAIFILVNRTGNLAGYIEYWLEKDNTINVASIQVRPDFRNGSVLRQLLSKAYRNLKSNPPSKVTTSVHINNRLSQKLNSKLGFEKIGEEKDRVTFEADGINLLKKLAHFSKR